MLCPHTLSLKNLVKTPPARFSFVCLATSVVGMSLGSLAASYGLALWIPLCLSIFVLAGTAEFIFIGFLAVGGSPIAAAIAGLLVNLRHLPFGIAVNELIRGKFSRYFGAHIMNDESVLFGMAQPDFETKKSRLLVMWYRHHADLATRCHCGLFYWKCYSRP